MGVCTCVHVCMHACVCMYRGELSMFCDVEEVTCNALLAVCECNLQCVCTSIRSVSNTCACMLYAYFSCVCVCVCEGGGEARENIFCH